MKNSPQHSSTVIVERVIMYNDIDNNFNYLLKMSCQLWLINLIPSEANYCQEQNLMFVILSVFSSTLADHLSEAFFFASGWLGDAEIK
ncbi:CLUMA_CG004092, isoform A [Clunio marinus]|uniref:CLUMA_CG004092, isoform A n=1 Tax=Clunio marinus TaxID=568069 RepID=A0A1J1HQN1_9DIPT|nr:CLUMA_CG004092, isoform A [Clunio marinus]